MKETNINLAGITFQAASNSHNGSLYNETIMRFTTDAEIVIGDYSGGTIQAGIAHARFSVDKEKKLQMHLDWQWLTGDQSKGRPEWIRI